LSLEFDGGVSTLSFIPQHCLALAHLVYISARLLFINIKLVFLKP